MKERTVRALLLWALALIAAIAAAVLLPLERNTVWWICVAGAALAFLIALVALLRAFARGRTYETERPGEEAASDRTRIMRDLRRRAAALAAAHPTPAVRALAEQLRFADPVSGRASGPQEAALEEFLTLAEELEDDDAIDQVAQRALSMLRQRNELARDKTGR